MVSVVIALGAEMTLLNDSPALEAQLEGTPADDFHEMGIRVDCGHEREPLLPRAALCACTTAVVLPVVLPLLGPCVPYRLVMIVIRAAEGAGARADEKGWGSFETSLEGQGVAMRERMTARRKTAVVLGQVAATLLLQHHLSA
jgi:hypothetical protein